MDNGVSVNEHLLASKSKCDILGVCTKKPKFPNYAIRSKREESYSNWPQYLGFNTNDLIDAGLVYTGVGDSVRCYHCGGGLRNWEPQDTPILEHAKWYPECAHVLLVKGKQYIDAAGRGIDLDVLHTTTNTKDQYKPDIHSVPAQSCLEMGYSIKDVNNAMLSFFTSNGHNKFKASDLLAIILDEEQTDTEIGDTCDNITVDNTPYDQSEEEDVQKMFEENQRIKENQTCKICLEYIASIIFLPCGHLVSCPQCASALSKCPICRIEVKGQVRALWT